jgi:nucleoside-diphosphate-sugar epimerase
VGKATTPGTEAFYYEKGQRPYEVDYLGQKNIVDECRRAGVEHVVLLGHMGGTVRYCSVVLCE